MTDHIELARRAIACKGWWWMAGMTTLYHDEDLPDLNDPATVGGLEQLVSNAYETPVWLELNWEDFDHKILSWRALMLTSGYHLRHIGAGATKAEVWVSALENVDV